MAEVELLRHQGCGNDLLYRMLGDGDEKFSGKQIAQLCDRHFGVGADGIIEIGRNGDEFTWDYHNADGGYAETCGNGLIGAGHILANLTGEKSFALQTPAGVRDVDVISVSPDKKTGFTKVAMGVATAKDVTSERNETKADQVIEVLAVNPHLVYFVNEIPTDWVEIGESMQSNYMAGVNVEFAIVRHRNLIEMKVWERGVGPSLGCGSGSTAIAAAAADFGQVDLPVEIAQPGGTVSLDKTGDTFYITGPSVFIAKVIADVAD